MGHWGESVQRQEGGLVVHVEGQARQQRVLDGVLAGARLHHLVPDGREVLHIEDGHQRQGGHQGEDGHNSVRVLGAQGLGPRLAHHTCKRSQYYRSKLVFEEKFLANKLSYMERFKIVLNN